MIQTYTFSGTGRQIDAQGVFFRYEAGSDGSGVTSIRVLADGAILGTFEPGDTIDLPTPAKRWEVYPTSNGCIGSVRIGNARVTSNKLQGIVQIVDGGKTRTVANQAFSSSMATQGSAGNCGVVALYNPAGSGRRAICSSFMTSCNVNSGYVIAKLKTGIFVSSTGTRFGISRKVGGAAGVCAAGGMSEQVVQTGQPEEVIVYAATTTPLIVRMDEPFILEPGSFLSVQGPANSSISSSFHWYEEQL
ncbi:hypothetical protein [Aquabacterium sp.]|uniref:hypothetical protein n=1 Tax=Aquabacterium sp. TaxID=1872578 RepID=UPI0025BB1225|nr:hypothetical protein [Aquabacterium sp.]